MDCIKVRLQIDESLKPKFHKPRKISFILRDMVKAELECLQQQGIFSLVKHARWAAPIVPVVKQKGTIRVCCDFKTTVNQTSPIETYPVPCIEKLFANLSGGQAFTNMDVTQAYLGTFT